MKISSVPQPAPVATESKLKTILALEVTPQELEMIFLSSAIDELAIEFYDEGVVEFEGQYYTFGPGKPEVAELRDFLRARFDFEDDFEDDSEVEPEAEPDAEPVTEAYPPSAPFGYDTSYGGDPASSDPQAAQTDMHGSATVENTTLLIEDLEKQLAVAKSENEALRLAVRTRSTDNEILLEENREFRERIGRQRTTITRYQLRRTNA